MGTTLDALQAGSTNYVYVAVIQGCRYLLCSGSTSAALAAWSGTDWTEAVGGLTVEIRDEQRLNPNEPFTSGGSCSLHVVPDAADTFGIYTAKRATGARTYLTATLDRDDTTATVQSTAAFDSSGEVHIGTECIAYSGKTSTTLTGLTRGKYSPFGAQFSTRFSHTHRVGLDAQSVNLQPAVTKNPRVWPGRWVGVWMHRVVGGVLDTKAEAHCVFAGRIDELRDDPNTFARVIHCTPVLDVIKEMPVGQGLWEGTANDTGAYLAAGLKFDFLDKVRTLPSTINDEVAATLTVVSGTPGVNEIAQGRYTASDLCSEISSWLTAQKAAGNLNGNYQFAVVNTDSGERTKITYTLTGDVVAWQFTAPESALSLLGITQYTSQPGGRGAIASFTAGTDQSYFGDSQPQRAAIAVTGGPEATIYYTTSTGDLVNQYTYLPALIKPPFVVGEQWGVFVVNDDRIILGEISTAGQIKYVQPAFEGPFAPPLTTVDTLRIRQILAFDGPLGVTIQRMLLSTGTAGYNHTLIDGLPADAGIGIPYEIVSGVIDSAPSLPGADGTVMIFIDKPTPLAEILRSDLIMRWGFFYWSNGSVRLGSWKSPVAALAAATLDETNKATPDNTDENPRSAAAEHREWYAPISVIRYNRDVADLNGNEYRSSIKFVDRSAVDASGGDAAIRSLSLRNTYREVSSTGQSVEALLANYGALVPLISRPANVITRSIDFRHFFRIAVGDIVLFTDKFARDPSTGEREITARPALVTRLNFSPGGEIAGSDQPLGIMGEVDLFFTDLDPERAGIAYVPSADVDDTADSGGFSSGYNSSTKTLRCYAHRYSESSESADAANFFTGDKIRIYQRDPLDGSSPVYWDDTVASQSGNDIVLTTGLSSPAWDADGLYRVTYQPWDSVVTAQKSKTFQADDADGLIADDGDPFLYAATGADPTYTANSSTEIELLPAAVYAEAFGRDVGHDAALIRAADSYADYKACVHAPLLFNSWQGNTTTGLGDYKLIGYWPIFLSYEFGSSAIYRLLTVAPWARSTDGTSTKIRVSLCRLPLNDLSVVNVVRGAVFGSAEWTGITSVTSAVLTPSSAINVNVKNIWGDGIGTAYVLVECGLKCETLGLARFVVGKRNVT